MIDDIEGRWMPASELRALRSHLEAACRERDDALRHAAAFRERMEDAHREIARMRGAAANEFRSFTVEGEPFCQETYNDAMVWPVEECRLVLTRQERDAAIRERDEAIRHATEFRERLVEAREERDRAARDAGEARVWLDDARRKLNDASREIARLDALLETSAAPITELRRERDSLYSREVD